MCWVLDMPSDHWNLLAQKGALTLMGSDLQLCTRVAQLEGKQSASAAHQQHDAVQARKFEILAAQVNETLHRFVALNAQETI